MCKCKCGKNDFEVSLGGIADYRDNYLTLTVKEYHLDKEMILAYLLPDGFRWVRGDSDWVRIERVLPKST